MISLRGGGWELLEVGCANIEGSQSRGTHRGISRICTDCKDVCNY
jgi:hypothetical protein